MGLAITVIAALFALGAAFATFVSVMNEDGDLFFQAAATLFMAIVMVCQARGHFPPPEGGG